MNRDHKFLNRRCDAAHRTGLEIGRIARLIHFGSQYRGILSYPVCRLCDLCQHGLEVSLHGDEIVVELAQLVDAVQGNAIGKITLSDVIESPDDPTDDSHDLGFHHQ